MTQAESSILVPASFSRRRLTRIFRRYAIRQGWNTHPRMIQARVEGWMDGRVGPMQQAFEYHLIVRRHRRRFWRTIGGFAGCSAMVVVVVKFVVEGH